MAASGAVAPRPAAFDRDPRGTDMTGNEVLILLQQGLCVRKAGWKGDRHLWLRPGIHGPVVMLHQADGKNVRYEGKLTGAWRIWDPKSA